MQKILFVLHLPPPVHGASVVGKCIHDSMLVNKSFDCHYVNLTTATSLEDIGKGGLGKLWAFCKKLWEIKRAIKKVKPDAVYITPNSAGGPFYKDFVVTELCKWWSGKKVILHFHNKGVSTRQEKWLDDKLYKCFFKNVEVILLGKPLYEDVRKYVVENQIHYCANGISSSNTAERLVKPQNTIPHILFLSNLLVSKGILDLLDSLVILKGRGIAFVCDIIGGETAELNSQKLNHEIEARGLADTTFYHGRKYGKEKDEYLLKSDIFCFPTYYHNECFPLVLLEAMQCGIPCISTNEGAISCIIDDNITGMLVKKQNIVQLADKLEMLLTNEPFRLQMGMAGREKFEHGFSLECFEQRFVSVIKECLN